jgi:hypothetical protein
LLNASHSVTMLAITAANGSAINTQGQGSLYQGRISVSAGFIENSF